MPTNQTIRAAMDEAFKATNEGHQITVATEAIFKSGTNAEMTKRMRGTLLKGETNGTKFYWFVPVMGDVATKAAASGAAKLSIVKAGSDITSVKVSEMQDVTHGILGMLASSQGAGEFSALTVAGLSATLAPTITADAMTELTLSVGSSPGVSKPVEEALGAAGLVWTPWRGGTAAEALVPVGPDLVTVAAGGAMIAKVEQVAGVDNFKAQSALAAMGVASATAPTTVAEVAGLAAAWAGMPDAAPALTVIMASSPNPQVEDRRTVALVGRNNVLARLRESLGSLTAEDMAAVAEKRAQLTALNVTVQGAHVGTWLAALANGAAAPPAFMGGGAAAVAPEASEACEREAERRVAEGGLAPGLTAATKATIVAAIAADLAREGFGAQAAQEAAAGLDALRITGAERMTPDQVLAEIAKVMSVSSTELAKGLAEARGATALPDMFALSVGRVAANAAGDLQFMAKQADVKFEAQPKSWAEASTRMGEIVLRFARVGVANRDVARSDDSAPAAEPTRRRRAEDLPPEEEGAKIYHSANADGAAAAGHLLTPLTTDSLRRSEAMLMATKPSGDLAEVHRLCTLDAGDLGRAAEALLLSDGKFSGALANRGNVAPSVVAGRERLVAWVEDRVESYLGADLTGEAGVEVAKMALATTTAQLQTTLVVKLLGAQKETYTQAGARTVVSTARFGSATGAPRPACAHGRLRRHTCRTRSRA